MSLDHLAENINRPQGWSLDRLAENVPLQGVSSTSRMSLDHLSENIGWFQGYHSTVLLKILLDSKDVNRSSCWKHWLTSRISLDHLAENVSRHQGCTRHVLLKILIVYKDVGHIAKNIDRQQGCLMVILLNMLIDHKDVTRPSCWKYWLTTRCRSTVVRTYVSTTRILVGHIAENDRLQGCRLLCWKYWLTTRMSLAENDDWPQGCWAIVCCRRY